MQTLNQITRIVSYLASMAFGLLALYFIGMSLSFEHSGTILVTRDAQVAIAFAVLSVGSVAFGNGLRTNLVNFYDAPIPKPKTMDLGKFEGIDKHVRIGYTEPTWTWEKTKVESTLGDK